MTDTDDTGMISGMGQKAWLLSAGQMGFQGSAKAVCDFTGGEGFVYIAHDSGGLAHGYRAIKK